MTEDYPKEARAFLGLICWAEGTSLGGRDPYRVVYGYGHTIQSFRDHPAITGEWTGKALPPKYCKAAGLRAGCKSTAAGAYQITRTTWLDKTLRWFYLPASFSPAEQDAFCWRALCRSLGVPRLLGIGKVEAAIIAAAKRWASLPKSATGQPQRTMDHCLAVYRRGLEDAP